jgi:hypothetical protein
MPFTVDYYHAIKHIAEDDTCGERRRLKMTRTEVGFESVATERASLPRTADTDAGWNDAADKLPSGSAPLTGDSCRAALHSQPAALASSEALDSDRSTSGSSFATPNPPPGFGAACGTPF